MVFIFVDIFMKFRQLYDSAFFKFKSPEEYRSIQRPKHTDYDNKV